MFIRKINFNGLRQIYTGELQEFNSYFNMNASTEEELLLSLNSRSKETKFEVTRILHEMETVETNYGRGSDSYEWSDTVISDIESEIIIETYYY